MRTWAAGIAVAAVLALAACSAAPRPDVTSLPLTVQTPLPDEGSAPRIAAVRASLVLALSTEDDQLSRAPDGTALYTPAQRKARLAAVLGPALAADDAADDQFLAADDEPYRSARFVARTWQGVVVRGDRAKAFVLGSERYEHWDGSTSHTPTFQYQALLVRHAGAPHGWLLTRYRTASNDQG